MGEIGTNRVTFTAVVVFDDDGALLGVDMDCRVCGEMGYKGSEAIVEHARTHPDAPEFVTISRSMMNELERQAGFDPGGGGVGDDAD